MVFIGYITIGIIVSLAYLIGFTLVTNKFQQDPIQFLANAIILILTRSWFWPFQIKHTILIWKAVPHAIKKV